LEYFYVFNELQDGSSSRYFLAMGSILNLLDSLQDTCLYTCR